MKSPLLVKTNAPRLFQNRSLFLIFFTCSFFHPPFAHFSTEWTPINEGEGCGRCAKSIWNVPYILHVGWIRRSNATRAKLSRASNSDPHSFLFLLQCAHAFM